MTDLKFTADHEWARLEGDVVTIGITDYAQDQLGELVYVELPETGAQISAGQEVVVIESVKARETSNPLSTERLLKSTPHWATSLKK